MCMLLCLHVYAHINTSLKVHLVINICKCSCRKATYRFPAIEKLQYTVLKYFKICSEEKEHGPLKNLSAFRRALKSVTSVSKETDHVLMPAKSHGKHAVNMCRV